MTGHYSAQEIADFVATHPDDFRNRQHPHWLTGEEPHWAERILVGMITGELVKEGHPLQSPTATHIPEAVLQVLRKVNIPEGCKKTNTRKVNSKFRFHVTDVDYALDCVSKALESQQSALNMDDRAFKVAEAIMEHLYKTVPDTITGYTYPVFDRHRHARLCDVTGKKLPFSPSYLFPSF